MDFTNNILNTINSKTGLTVTITQSSFIVTLLAWCGVITPVVGCIAGICGAVIGIHAVWAKIIKPFFHKHHLKNAKIKPKHEKE